MKKIDFLPNISFFEPHNLLDKIKDFLEVEIEGNVVAEYPKISFIDNLDFDESNEDPIQNEIKHKSE